MKINYLKYGVLFVFLLTQNPAFAQDPPGNENTVGSGSALSSPPRRVRGKRLNQLLEMQEKIREINGEIHSRLDAVLFSENAEERSVQALNLIKYLRYAYGDYGLSQKLEKMDDLAKNEKEPTDFRRTALEILGEHSIPNTLTRSSLEFMAMTDEDPILVKDTKETLSKLKIAQSQTGRKFSDLLAYSHESDNVKEAIALLWIAIYKDDPAESLRLLKWLSNDDPNKRQIGLLIAEEMERRGGMMTSSRAVKNKIRQLKRDAAEAAETAATSTDSLTLVPPSSAFQDSDCNSHHFLGHGPVVPRHRIH